MLHAMCCGQVLAVILPSKIAQAHTHMELQTGPKIHGSLSIPLKYELLYHTMHAYQREQACISQRRRNHKRRVKNAHMRSLTIQGVSPFWLDAHPFSHVNEIWAFTPTFPRFGPMATSCFIPLSTLSLGDWPLAHYSFTPTFPRFAPWPPIHVTCAIRTAQKCKDEQT